MRSIEREFYEHIDKIKQSDTLIIVEGKKDKKALENLGIKNIIELNKKPLFVQYFLNIFNHKLIP